MVERGRGDGTRGQGAKDGHLQGDDEAGPAADAVLHRSLGVTDEEAARIARILGREPNPLEIAMYAAMWSEHCSYKSSRLHLRRLPTDGPRVLVGPGENAGVIDAGDGVAVALRIESHNHPSAVEPYQGAATGVGGILRDIFTMGARPIALMDPLRFGSLDDPRTRYLFENVVGGISAYGNAVGVPTVGGEIAFERCYSGNPLVNVLCLGVLPVERLVLGRASGVGNLAVLLGSSTGRDGIGGVSVLASAGFDARPKGDGSTGSKRPSVQVGDPFEEKRLIEACLELLDAHLVVGIQDLGGAGLTCAASETAARAGLGMDVDVRSVRRREPGMEPFEVMTSESQERMLAIVSPDNLDRVRSVCDRWEVAADVVGRVTPAPPEEDAAADEAGADGVTATAEKGCGRRGGRLRVLDGWNGPVLADVPAPSLADGAPLYDRPRRAPTGWGEPPADDPTAFAEPDDCSADLLGLLCDPSGIYRQYDHQLFLNTVVGPGGDAAVLRLRAPGLPPGDKALAISTDGCGRWCAVDPRLGTAMVVAESSLNVACAGAEPVAVVNCLNLGNPEHPEVMWQLSEVVDGMAEACTALRLPVVGGNVSLYNETDGADIDPTPVVGVVGLIERLERCPPGPVLVEGGAVFLVGPRSSHPGGSIWADRYRGRRGESLPPLDLVLHGRVLELVRDLVIRGHVQGVHDVSEGGLAVALTEMALRGRVGARVSGVSSSTELFSEAPSRALVCARDAEVVHQAGRALGVAVVEIGRARGDRISIDGFVDISVEEADGAWRDALSTALAAG
jgi:phosphoribosylformylglycinamidine synthase subunit PurL